MLQKLKNYYETNKISAKNFHCDDHDNCEGELKNFTTAKEAFVGTKYEKGDFRPRILFISLDSGGDTSEPEWREMRKVRESLEGINIENISENIHWYQTHVFAYEILKNFKADLTPADTTPYFAHINSAKCCANLPGKKKAPRRMFTNCKKYIPKEVEILNPDIIVAQGENAWYVRYDETEHHAKKYNCSGEIKDCGLYLISLNGKEVMWIDTYHPGPRTRKIYQNQLKNCLQLYQETSLNLFKT
ncbi:MAG: hypothetical protein OQJ93_04685 [Ignavibacteriaceae bacterium]|nr:hypothetical protein [Ignavibacteriaceae bacterium]